MRCEIIVDGQPLGVEVTHGAILSEAVGAYPRFEFDATFSDARTRILKAVGARARWLARRGGAEVCLFEGDVHVVRYHPHRTQMQCAAPTAKLDAVRRTRSFSTADGALAAMHTLPGLQAAFPGVHGLNRLTAQVADVTQFDESDWTFLRRLGARYGLWLLAHAGRVELTVSAGGDCVTLSGVEIISDDEEVTLRSEVAGAQSRAWQFPLGQAPAAANMPRLVRGFASEDTAGQEGERLSGVNQTQAFLAALAPGWGNAEEAARLARIQQTRLLSWSGSLLRPELSVGNKFRLPETLDLGAPLVVVRRQLSYSPLDANHQLINRVVAAADLYDPDAPVSPDEDLSVPGIVLDVQDTAHLGRIRVRFPWQADGEGLWCLAPQPDGGKGHGVVHIPSPGDWVAVSFEHNGMLPPVVIGSIYHSGAQASTKAQNPAQQRILARTATGHLIMLDDDRGEIIVAVQPGDDPLCSVVLKKDPAAITVHVPGGKVVVQAKEAKLTLGDNTIKAEADSIELKGNTSIKLTAPQVAVQATGGVTVSNRLTVQQ